jgi:hypothetical protein
MAIVSSGGGATIHQFPAGRNLGRRRFEQPATVVDIRLVPMATVDYSSWYHDEAIREEQAPQP